MSLKDNLLAVLIIFIWGFNFVIIQWGVNDMPPLLMGAARFLLVGVIGLFLVKKPKIAWRWLFTYALVLCFGQFSLLFSAIAFGMPAGLASLVLQSQAVFTLLFSGLLLREIIKPYQLIAMIIAGVGLYVIGFVGQQTNMTLLGFSLTIAAAISWALGNVINKVITKQGEKVGLGLVVWSSWFACGFFVIASALIEGTAGLTFALKQFSWATLLVLVYLAVAASILGYSLWSYLLSKYPAGQVAPLTLGVPVVGIVCAQYFLNEMITQYQYIGIALVMLGLFVNALGGKISLSYILKSQR